MLRVTQLPCTFYATMHMSNKTTKTPKTTTSKISQDLFSLSLKIPFSFTFTNKLVISCCNVVRYEENYTLFASPCFYSVSKCINKSPWTVLKPLNINRKKIDLKTWLMAELKHEEGSRTTVDIYIKDLSSSWIIQQRKRTQ